ncbi:hypothetical protein [Burkholderia diffusa]|uniref:hypothetical protein n=1 Tax=Burkholderia diffusa TaxID=488732 RepID=UPI0012DB287B|nr:hypothetical protein [Burkholderia diffusa]
MAIHNGGTIMTGNSHSKQGEDSAVTKDPSGSGSTTLGDNSQSANVRENWNSGHPGGVGATTGLPDSAVSLDDPAEIPAGLSVLAGVVPQANLRGQLKWNEQSSAEATSAASAAINNADPLRGSATIEDPPVYAPVNPDAGDPINHYDPAGEGLAKPDSLGPFGRGGVN